MNSWLFNPLPEELLNTGGTSSDRNDDGGNSQEESITTNVDPQTPPIPSPESATERTVSFDNPTSHHPGDDPNDKGNDVEEDSANTKEENTSSAPELYLEHYFRDHFTLSTPSSLVRFRSANTAARVFENKTSQFILEEQIDEVSLQRRIHVKQLSDGTVGLQFLRILYTVMTVFWTGIFFVSCLQVLLIMVLELAIQVGTTELSPDLDIFRLIG